MAHIESRRITPNAGAEPAVREPLAPGTTIARYRIVSLIGSGAMGDVYRAHDRVLDREVALKILPPELVHDRDRVRRFAQEARAASALSHPHIVSVHEVGHARPSLNIRPIAGSPQGRPHEVHYIVMEYVEGKTFRELLMAAIPLRRAVEILTQVADGLGKAHSEGIVHRDLKPENVLVATEGYAKIVDFGLAKLVDAERGWNPIGADSPTLRALTVQGELLGTPGYMAPEQVAGRTIDSRADIFSLGCILYESITRRRPFEAESFVDALYKIMHEEPVPVTSIVPDVTPELQRIVSKCMAKDRELRYQSVKDVALDLRQWLASEGVASEPKARRIGTKPWIAGAIVLALLPLLGQLLFTRKPAEPAPREERTIQRMTANGSAMQVAISPDARYLAYCVSDARGRSLWLEQTATHSAMQIVPPAPERFSGVAFSPDGNYVYFARYGAGAMATLQRLPLIGGNPESLVHDVDSPVTFSPDGRSFAFIREDWNRAICALIVYGAGSERTLSTFNMPDHVYSPAWSPDGKRIVVTFGTKVVAIDYPSGVRHEIEPSVRFENLRGLAFDPKGTIIASASSSESSDRNRLWNIDLATGEARPLTDELADVVAPAISADGANIAALQVTQHSTLFAVDDHGMHQLTFGANSTAGLNGLTWAGERAIHTSANEGVTDLWSVDLRGGEPVRLTHDKAFESHPAATPDGSAIVYAASFDGQTSLWSMKPDGTDRRQLTKGPRDSDFAISPDSKTLAWSSYDADAKEWVLWSMPLAGGTPRRIASRSNILEQMRWTPDGRSILFTGYESSMLRIYRIPAAGGTAVELTKRPAHDAEISPDGTSFLCPYDYAIASDAPLALIPLAGSSQPKVFPLHGTQYRWRDAKQISFVHGSNLFVQPPAAASPKRLTNFDDGSIPEYAWSADGKRAVVAHKVQSLDVVLIQRK